MNQFLSKTLFYLVGITCAFLLMACSDPNDIELDDDYILYGPEGKPVEEKDNGWPPTFEHEIYGDPEIFSTPRIQYVAYIIGVDNERSKLWSMKKDGSDRRLVADNDLLFNGSGIVHLPKRSSDNRYVALSMDDGEFFRGIIDLKEKKAIRIMKGGGYPHFNWTSDSKELYFYNDGKLMRYYLETGELTQEKTIYSIGLFLLPDDKTFLAMKKNGYWLHNRDGSVIKKVDFAYSDNISHKYPIVSPDGRQLAFYTVGRHYIALDWIDVGSEELLGSEDVESILSGTYLPIFDDKPSTLHLRKAQSIYQVELNTKSKKKIEKGLQKRWWQAGLNHYSLINYKSSQYYQSNN